MFTMSRLRSTERINAKKFWKLIYLLSFLLGGTGLLAVNLNIITGNESTFEFTQIIQFLTLIFVGFFVRFFIYPQS
jgi:ABC-type multidrug transport system permease subunit